MSRNGAKKPSFEVPIIGMLPDTSGQAGTAKKLGFKVYYFVVYPPSTVITEPVTYDDSSLAKNRAA